MLEGLYILVGVENFLKTSNREVLHVRKECFPGSRPAML